MKRFALSIAVATCLTLALAPLHAASAKDTWTSVRSKNFYLVGNASEKDIRRIGVQLEQFRDVLTRLISSVKPISTVPITVVVFKSDDSFKPFRPPTAAAYFQSGEDVNYIALTSERRDENPYAAIFHEYVHVLIKNNTEHVPLWFNEGLAEYYSSFDMMDGNRKAMIGKPINSHVLYLRQQKMLPLETLFAVTQGSPIYNERDKQGVFYAESWALVHYLLLGNEGKRAPQFKHFLNLLASGTEVEEAFKQAFQTDYRTLEKELRQYIGRRSYAVSVTTFNEKLAFDTGMQSAPLTDAQAQFYLGDLLLHTSQLDRAEKYLQEAVRLDPDLARAHASLGMLNLRRERFDEAKKHLERAVASDTKNYLVHYYYAYMLSRAHMRGDSYASEFAPELADLMRAELRKAIELAPDYAESYHLLAFINLVMGEKLDESIQLLKHAMTLAPGEQRFGNVLAQLYMRKRDYKTARQILEPIASHTGGDEPQSSAQAQSLLQTISSIEKYEASNPSRGGDDEHAGAPTGGAATASPSQTRRRADGDPSSPDADPQTAFQQSLLPKRAGEERARGQLLRIDCNAQGVTMTIKVGDRTLHLHNNDLVSIKFITFTQEMRGEISCGPRNPPNPVIVSYRAVKDAKSKTDGQVTAIAFLSKELDAIQ